jgi:hypothetical protein
MRQTHFCRTADFKSAGSDLNCIQGRANLGRFGRMEEDERWVKEGG